MIDVRAETRIAYTLIDITIYAIATLYIARLLGWDPPPIAFMQEYSGPQRETYWSMLFLAFAVVGGLSIAGHAAFGRSIGKWLLGVKSVRADGRPLGILGALRRLLYVLSLLALIVIPGPLVAFTFGAGTERISSWLLTIALLAVPVLALAPFGKDGSPLLQPYFGVKTIYAPRW